MSPSNLESIKALVLGLWTKATPAQMAVMLEGVSKFEFDSVAAIVREVARSPHKGFLDAAGKIVDRCRAAVTAKRESKPRAVEEWTHPTEGTTPGELCDMAYAGTLTGPLANATPRGKAWMKSIGEKRARARSEGREPFEPSGAELIFAATSMGQSRIGKSSKRDMDAKAC